MIYNKISDRISFIKASEPPLSSDVGVVFGDECLWVYDVGRAIENIEMIHELAGEKKINVVLSHFHPDHTANLKDIRYDRLLQGKNTYDYTHLGEVVQQELCVDDGMSIRIIPLPNSHAKGSLMMVVDDEYAFVGDAVYGMTKGGRYVYNAQFLQAEIEFLKGLSAKYLLVSHKDAFVYRKDTIVRWLGSIYARRQKNDCYIQCNSHF